MRKRRYSEEQIIRILRQVEAGEAVKDVCREHGFSEGTYYRWKAKYGGWISVRRAGSRSWRVTTGERTTGWTHVPSVPDAHADFFRPSGRRTPRPGRSASLVYPK